MEDHQAPVLPTATEAAEWVTALRYETLPADVVRLAKLCLLDQLGVQIRGSSLPQVRPVAELVEAMDTRPESSVVGRKVRAAAPYAAYANATFAHSCELDDAHTLAWHASSCVVPVVLAFAERDGRSGREVIEAVVSGQQVMSVLGKAIRMGLHRAGWHGMKVLGVMGAAAGAAKILRLNAEQTRHAIAIAASDASGTMEYDQSGGEVKRLHAGAPARSGAQAALLAGNGFTGPSTILEGKRGVLRLFGAAAPLASAEGAWNHFHILDTIFKLYPAVGTVHSPLDALRHLRDTHQFGPEEVEAIDVGLIDYAVSHGAHITRPTDTLSAQFSLAFSLALMLVRGRASLDDYGDPNLWTDPTILSIVDKVRTRAVTFPAGNPELGAIVTVHLQSRSVEHYQIAFRGHFANPASDEDIVAKFREVVANRMPADRIDELAQQTLRLEDIEDVSAFVSNAAALGVR